MRIWPGGGVPGCAWAVTGVSAPTVVPVYAATTGSNEDVLALTVSEPSRGAVQLNQTELRGGEYA